MQSINERAEEMLTVGLDWSEHKDLSGEMILATFYRKSVEQVWIVDMANAGCNPDAAKKIGLVISRAVQ